MLEINPVGIVEIEEGRFYISINKKYRDALKELSGFSHINVIWWGNLSDSSDKRDIMVAKKPYKKAPETVGIFATRSNVRPNPVLISAVQIISINVDKGIIELPWIDAEAESPVIDIKPYQPCFDRIKKTQMPDWCANWPEWYEDSGTFDWSTVFNF
ncbi:MAG: SAM-dependent methyltransferase [Desulfobacterales bacterium]|nr:SAM-dependent methyltransferase [Desulfobacterales bacterium]